MMKSQAFAVCKWRKSWVEDSGHRLNGKDLRNAKGESQMCFGLSGQVKHSQTINQ